MQMEKDRGISITSTALTFEYGGKYINILDTPGHQDFSEDTYRTLSAADNTVMLVGSRLPVIRPAKVHWHVGIKAEISAGAIP